MGFPRGTTPAPHTRPLPQSLVLPCPRPGWVINSQGRSEGPSQPQFLIWFGRVRLFPALGNNQAWHSPGHKCASPGLCASLSPILQAPSARHGLPPLLGQAGVMGEGPDSPRAPPHGVPPPAQRNMRGPQESPRVALSPFPMPLPSMAGSTPTSSKP